MKHYKIAIELAETFNSGNRSDLVEYLKGIPALDAALVALYLARHHATSFTEDIIQAIEARR